MANEQNLKPFKKGHKSKGGRPKGSKSLTKVLEKLLNKEIQIEDDKGKKVKKKPAELIAMALINEAKNGNVKAAALVWDRVEGKAVQKTVLSGEDGEPIEVKLNPEEANKIKAKLEDEY